VGAFAFDSVVGIVMVMVDVDIVVVAIMIMVDVVVVGITCCEVPLPPSLPEISCSKTA
jgi:hypothetical protein